ncbi:MAG: hypothetical protein FJX67_11410 [Alphaproteobacteria bacterium]|nr:hypothetical protein [Alphaproteobacteria bacterium]
MVFGVPLVAFLAVSAYLLLDSRSAAARADRLGAKIAHGRAIADVVHELQKERGLSAIYLASGGQRMGREIDDQRRETDQKRAAVARLASDPIIAAEPALARIAAEAAAALAPIEDRRQTITGRTIDGAASAAYYTATIAKQLALIVAFGRAAEVPEVSGAFKAYVSLLEAKERAGLERATGATGITLGRFDATL